MVAAQRDFFYNRLVAESKQAPGLYQLAADHFGFVSAPKQLAKIIKQAADKFRATK